MNPLDTNPRLGAQLAHELALIPDDALRTMAAVDLAFRRGMLSDAVGMLIAQGERLAAEATRRELAARMSDSAIVEMLVRVATDLGRAPAKRPFFYPTRGEWLLDFGDRMLSLDGEAFLQLEGVELEYFVREEIAACLGAPARDPEQR